MFVQFLKNNKGVGIVEILISSAIVLTIFTALISFLSGVTKQIEDVSDASLASKSAAYIVQSLLSHSNNYQFYPPGKSGFAGIANTEQSHISANPAVFDVLAFAIDSKGDIIKAEDCPHCESRIGLSLIPLSNTRGLFKIWIVGIERQTGSTPNSYSYKAFLDLKMLLPLN